MIESVFKNGATTYLSASSDAIQTSFSVVDASVFPTISENESFIVIASSSKLNFEILKVTAIVGNTLTVVRAQEGTTAKIFDIGTMISNRLTAGQINEIINEINKNQIFYTNTNISKELLVNEHCTVIDSNIVITLPTNPSIGDTVYLSVNDSVNTLLNGNGYNIMFEIDDITIDIAWITLILIYTDNITGWRIL